MKKYIALFAILISSVLVMGQSFAPINVTEVDGFPVVYGARRIVVSNGTLAKSGTTATITTGGGGGGSISVNGGSVSSPNFNGTTPSVPAGGAGVLYQVSGSNISSYLDVGAMAVPFAREPRIELDFLSTNLGDFASSGAIAAGTFVLQGSSIVSANHPGVRAILSSTSANSGFWFYSNQDSIVFGGGERIDVIFRTPASFSTVTARFGFHDTNGAFDVNDGAYFQYSGTGDLVGKTASNATRTTSNTITTLAVDTWYHGVILVNNNATSITFSVYSEAGSLLGSESITTNIPTASGREFGAGANAFSSGTTSIPLLYIDYIAATWTRPLTRSQ